MAIAETLVRSKLGASVNLMAGKRSLSRWQGAVTDTSETHVLTRTTAENLTEVHTVVFELLPHVGDLPPRATARCRCSVLRVVEASPASSHG